MENDKVKRARGKCCSKAKSQPEIFSEGASDNIVTISDIAHETAAMNICTKCYSTYFEIV